MVMNKSPETRLVILTNGLLTEKFTGFFKTLSMDRLFFQISMDGDEGQIRGPVHYPIPASIGKSEDCP